MVTIAPSCRQRLVHRSREYGSDMRLEYASKQSAHGVPKSHHDGGDQRTGDWNKVQPGVRLDGAFRWRLGMILFSYPRRRFRCQYRLHAVCDNKCADAMLKLI